MKSYTSTEFRKHIAKILDEVEQGERVMVYRHGKMIAEVHPAPDRGREPSWKHPVPRLVAPGPSIARAILEGRNREV